MPYHREAGSTKFGKMKLGGEIRPTEKVIVQVAGQAVEVEVTKPPWADEDPELWEAQKMETAKPIATTDVHTMPNQIFALLALLASVASASFAPSVHARHGRTAAAAPCRPPLLQRSGPLQPLRSPPVVAMARQVVVTDMDETLISKKSTGYIVKFLVMYRAFIRLCFCLPPAMLILIPLSKIKRWFDGRTLAVRIMYFLAFRGLSVERAERIAREKLPPAYVSDLQDPATTAVLEADEAVILTASPSFMARPWLGQFLGVTAANVYGAELEVANGRFTGRTGDLPIGEKKVELLKDCTAASAPDTETTGYGDHPTDVPFLQKCSRGVLVHALPEEVAAGCAFEPASALDEARIATLVEARQAAA